MSERECASCCGCGWVCENHPDKPWSGYMPKDFIECCGGAGMPCQCNPLSAKTENPDPRCPTCGFTLCQQFDERSVTASASIATPNGNYRCYHCSGVGKPAPAAPTEYTAVEESCRGCMGPCGRCHEAVAPTEALKALVRQAIKHLKHVHVLDCGAHYCRYCPAKSPKWEHTPSCPYLESQKRNTEALKLRAQLSAALSTPSAGWQPIETADHDEVMFYWVVPLTSEEAGIDMSLPRFFDDLKPHRHIGKFGSWSSLEKAVLCYPLPAPPAGSATGDK